MLSHFEQKESEVAFMSPGLQGLHRHGGCRWAADMCLQSGGSGSWSPGRPGADWEWEPGGSYGPSEVPEVRCFHGCLLLMNLTSLTLFRGCYTAVPLAWWLWILSLFLQLYCPIFNRIYQLAKLNYTKEATSNKPKAPEVYDLEGDSSNTLLNLDPETAVFYVGGYPPDFQVRINVDSSSEALQFWCGTMTSCLCVNQLCTKWITHMLLEYT